MGNLVSGSSGYIEPKDTTRKFEQLRKRLRDDLATHTSVIEGVKEKIKAHTIAMDKFTKDLKDDKDTKGKRAVAAEYTNCVKVDLNSQCSVLEGTLDHLKQSLETIISDDVSETLATSTNRLSKLEEENYILKSENGNLKACINSLETEIRAKEADIEKLNRQKRDMEATLGRLTHQLDDLKIEMEVKLKTLTQQVDDLKRKNEFEKRENDARKHKLYESENTIWSLRNELSRLEKIKRMQKVSVPIQIYCERRDELMMRVMDELTAMLVTQMSTNNIELGCTRCDRREDIQRDKLLLVLCINASRIGTDAGNAIAGIPQPDRTALLVLHHKSMHALPNQSSDRMLTTSEFKSLGGIFDMAFLADKGIYPCDMNNAAVNGILNFVKSRSPSSS